MNSPCMNDSEKNSIRDDRYLRTMMKTGVPLALISVACLWLGRSLGISGLGGVFIVTMAITLMIGFAYNVRFVMLLARQRRQPR